ncbi:MAG TPA: hypothetical protein VHF27_10715 [Acidimicrobiales bacterium]|nr:hypothetical protein [Acidimicrobiales bacterium]
MIPRPRGRRIRVCLATIAVSSTVVGVGQSPAHAATAVQGFAYGYYTYVSLFGGPYTLRGFNQPADAPAIAATPAVALPSSGGSTSLTDSDGSMAAYGPAVIFGWYDTATETYVSSGSQTVLTQGSTSGSGSVLTRATINNAGPGPLVMPQIVTTCQQTGSTVSPSVQITNGFVETSTDPNTGEVTSTQSIPTNPTPGTTISGTLDHIGDSFTIVFNEQTTNADGSTTVVGAHMYLLGPIAVGHMVVGATLCGVTP